MSTKPVSRRSFIRSTSSTAAALTAAGPAFGALGANERIRVASIGTGGQGTFHIGQLRQFPDVEIVAVCDVDPQRLKNAAEKAGANPKQTTEYREIIDMKDVDAVFIATCGHWHAIPALLAMQAGKDVYCEKPMGHTIHEGRLIADAQKKYKRVFQTGMQQRSGPHWINAAKRIKEGELGQITTINVWNAWNAKEMGGNLGNPPDSDPPAGVDYDRWLGPAPKRPFNKARWHFSFYFHWDYSGGMMSAWGVHLFDVVTWYIGYNIKSVSTVGGIYVLKDARETPDTAQAVFDCGDYVMTYSLRHANGWRLHDDMDHGIEFIGTRGVMQINRNGYHLFHEADRGTRKPYYSEKRAGKDWGNSLYLHKKNFFDCMRSRKQTNTDALAGHRGTIPGHLANISCRVGRRLQWDAKNETIPNDSEAAKLLTKHYRPPYTLPAV